MAQGRGKLPRVTRRIGRNQCALHLEKGVLDKCFTELPQSMPNVNQYRSMSINADQRQKQNPCRPSMSLRFPIGVPPQVSIDWYWSAMGID